MKQFLTPAGRMVMNELSTATQNATSMAKRGATNNISKPKTSQQLVRQIVFTPSLKAQQLLHGRIFTVSNTHFMRLRYLHFSMEVFPFGSVENKNAIFFVQECFVQTGQKIEPPVLMTYSINLTFLDLHWTGQLSSPVTF